MKTKIISSIVLVATWFALTANAQEPIVISGTKFTYPLINKWITEYNKVNPNAKFQLVSKKTEGQVIDLSITAHQPEKTDLQTSQNIVYVSKYALLPVASNSSSILKNVKKRGLNKKELTNIFFEEGLLDEETKKSKTPLNVYSRETQACSSIAFANYFGYLPSDIRGKKITGDDIYLISSIKKDTTGITYNNLGYIFDVQTRKVKEGISIIPLELGKDNFAGISNSIDEALNILEKEKFETIPVENVGLVINNNTNKEIANFVKWVIADGQKYNHEFGFLNLEKDLLSEQNEKLSEKFLTLK